MPSVAEGADIEMETTADKPAADDARVDDDVAGSRLVLAPLSSVVLADEALARSARYRQLRSALGRSRLNVWAAPVGTADALEAAGKRIRRASPKSVLDTDCDA